MNEQPLDGGAVEETQPTEEKTEEQIYAEEVARRKGQQSDDEITSSEEASATGDATPNDDEAEPEDDAAQAASDEGPEALEDGANGASDEELAKKEQEAKRLKGTVNSQNRKITKQSQRIKELEDKIASFANERTKAREIKSLDELKEMYPEWMGPISEHLNSLKEDVQTLSEQSRANAELHAERKKEFIVEQENLLSEKMSDWREFVGKNKDAFWNFVRTELTVPEAELAFASQKGVTDAEGVYSILSKARAHIEGRSTEPMAKPPSSQKPKPSRRLDGARAISSTGSQSSATDRPDDLDGLTAYQRAVRERAKNWGAI